MLSPKSVKEVRLLSSCRLNLKKMPLETGVELVNIADSQFSTHERILLFPDKEVKPFVKYRRPPAV